MENNIDRGDYVTHKNINLNNGLQMSVVDISETQAKISYFDHEGVDKEEWFDFSELILVNKAKGGFID